MVLALDQVTQSRKIPASITVDQKTEFTSLVMDDWVHVNQVSLAFKRPGKTTDKVLYASFNGRLRGGWLNVHEFKSIEEAR